MKYSQITVKARPKAADHSYFFGSLFSTVCLIVSKSHKRNSVAMIIPKTLKPIQINGFVVTKATSGLVAGMSARIRTAREDKTDVMNKAKITVRTFCPGEPYLLHKLRA